jgi:hypothetical protein
MLDDVEVVLFRRFIDEHEDALDPVRFVVCIDIEGASTLEDAYRNLCELLKNTPYGYQTSDEAYWPDGERIKEGELQDAIYNVLGQEEDD